MANNVNSTKGFVPCGAYGQGEYKGTIARLVHPASDGTAVYKYMMVKLDGGADAATGLPTAIAAGDTDTPVGIVVGFEPLPTSLNTHHCAASTRRVMLVARDKDIHFRAIGDDVGTTLDVGHAGNNTTAVTMTPSTITGHSGLRLDSSEVNTTNTLTIRLLKVSEGVGQKLASSDKYKEFICKFNLHQDSSTTGVA